MTAVCLQRGGRSLVRAVVLLFVLSREKKSFLSCVPVPVASVLVGNFTGILPILVVFGCPTGSTQAVVSVCMYQMYERSLVLDRPKHNLSQRDSECNCHTT